jgi:hypothetical protein
MVDPQTFSAKQRRDQQAFANRRDRAVESWSPPATALVRNDKHQRATARRNCQRNHLYANK